MLLSLNWLREFTPYEGEWETLADRLTMLGLEFDDATRPFEALERVVVGKVVECQPHPDADKLSMTRVDIGSEVLPIVCGAPNVAAGQTVAVATVGTVLPGDFKIKKAKIRGVESLGMICSERELGLTDDHTGIMVLPDDLTKGDKVIDALGLDHVVLDIDITPNRGDCLSILGLAREVALVFDLPLTIPTVDIEESGQNAADLVRVEIDDPALCPLFQARVIKDISIGPSPAWMRYRLIAMGVRPINNVVDCTNYVMMELGQPQHAYDLSLLAGPLLRVATAGETSEIVTLDNQTRKLVPDDLLIWDADKPVGLAGVMGAANTEVHDGSTDIALEAAVFAPTSVRRTARRLALPSEASYRNERGVDQQTSPLAVDRCAQLIARTAGGTVCPGVSRSEPRPYVAPTVPFRTARAAAIMGLDYGDDFCAKTLRGLGCDISEAHGEGQDAWAVSVPSHRPDLEREEDLVEEIGRVYGIDKLPTILPAIRSEAESDLPGRGQYGFIRRVKDWARGVGLRECINFSFVGDRDLNMLGLPRAGRVEVANPLSEDQGVMRNALAPGLLQNMATNISQGVYDLRLFEVAKVFTADPLSETGAAEAERLGILLHGDRFGGRYPWPTAEVDYADLKGLVEHLFASLGLPQPSFILRDDHAFLAPYVECSFEGMFIGVLGRLHTDLSDDYEARGHVWMAELMLDELRRLAEENVVSYTPLPRYPASKRDITVVGPLEVTVDEILEVFTSSGEKLLVDVRLIDEFRPEDAQERNLTFRLTYRHPEKTLKDKDVDKAHDRLAKRLPTVLPVRQQ
jgi:phenylalanyl-tRNA synthetase beta chain